MRTSALLLLLVAIVATNAVAPLLHADNPKAIQGSYIVVLKDELTAVDRDAHVLSLRNNIKAANADAEIGFVYNSLMGFSARLTEDLLKAELAHPDVKYIEVDQTMSIFYEVDPAPAAPAAVVTQTGATWGIARVGQKALGDIRAGDVNNFYYSSSAGTGANVYVIDTGVYTANNDFLRPDGSSRATAAYNAVTNEANNDLNGHGTHCAGTIGGNLYGVAKDVLIFGVKVLNAQGSGTTAGVVAGVDWVTNNFKAPAVGSMSLGGGASQALDDSVVRSITAGVSYAIAAGNSNTNACNSSPARVDQAVTVGATTVTDDRATYTNYGPCVDIYAPGTNIKSAWIGSPSATNTISGTSMATPHVAGALATTAAQIKQTPVEAKQYVIAQSTPNLVKGLPATPASFNRLLYLNPEA